VPPFFKTKRIKPARSLGKILSSKRRKLDLSLKEVEKKTKIKRSYLVNIEEERWGELPSEVYVIGFLSTYSKLLKLDSKKLIKHYKKENTEVIAAKEKKIRNPQEVKVKRFFITSQMLAVIIFLLLALGLGGYLWFQISGFAAAPGLEILEPKSNEVKTSDEKIKVSGKTDPDSSISLNNEPIPVSIEGGFSQEISLQKGVNILEVISENKAGKKTTKVIQVMVE